MRFGPRQFEISLDPPPWWLPKLQMAKYFLAALQVGDRVIQNVRLTLHRRRGGRVYFYVPGDARLALEEAAGRGERLVYILDLIPLPETVSPKRQNKRAAPA